MDDGSLSCYCGSEATVMDHLLDTVALRLLSWITILQGAKKSSILVYIVTGCLFTVATLLHKLSTMVTGAYSV